MQKETQNVEFKSSWQDDHLKWICGFANAVGGVLQVGKDDSGRVLGLTNPTKVMEDAPKPR